MNIRIFVGAIVLVVLFNLNDVLSSFSGHSVVSKAPEPVKLLDTETPANSETAQIDLEKLWARYEILEPSPEPEPVETQNATEEVVEKEIAIDKTLLPSFSQFDEDHQISLVAVFNAEQSFALVELLNYASRESQFKKISLNENLYEFELIDIQDNKVLFKKGDDTLQLQLFR